MVTQVIQVVWVVQVVRVARTTSLDYMHSENIWFSRYKLSKYREKLICHACDGGGRTDAGKWKIVQYFELNQKPQKAKWDFLSLFLTPSIFV